MTNPCQAVSTDATAVAVLACELWPEHSLEEMRSEFTSLLAREDAASSCTESREKWTLHSVSFAGMMWREEACTEFSCNIPKEGVAYPMIKQIMERFPGIGCVWMNAAGKESAAYFGAVDRKNSVAVNDNTVFPACSISKFVTALCVMKLQAKKAIDIDQPVNDYLRQWKLLTHEGQESDATIRALLCHTAGIQDGEEGFCGLRRSDPEISLMAILEGRTAYNNRPVRAEKPQGTAFEYSDAGYCVLQLMLQEVTRKAFEDIAQELIFDPLCLENTFFATNEKIAHFENRMATGYDDNGLPITGRFPLNPDLAASGLWRTPKELLIIAKAFVKAFHGESPFLQKESAREMARPVKDFPWTGLGVFTGGEDVLVSQGWGENGQCMVKMNIRTKKIAVVMTNRNPGIDQAESGVEWLADGKLNEKG